MSFWKVEISEEGGVYTAEPCESKGANGRRIIYVEANTKAEACLSAKAWHENRKKLAKSRQSARVLDRKARGLCVQCSKVSRANFCDECRARRLERQRDRRHGEPLLRQHEVGSHYAHGRYLAGIYIWALGKFDKLGPAAFRGWLVAEIEARTVKAEAPAARSEAAE